MPLVLQPSLDEHSRQEIEDHVAAVQARRMVAAIEYHKGITDKIDAESDKIFRKLKQQYEMLGKELERLDKADEAIQKRMQAIAILQQEAGVLSDMLMEE